MPQFLCEHEFPESSYAKADGFECKDSDVIQECICCGKKLCRRHVNTCCDQTFCEYCLETHQTEDNHIPYQELVA